MRLAPWRRLRGQSGEARLGSLIASGLGEAVGLRCSRPAPTSHIPLKNLCIALRYHSGLQRSLVLGFFIRGTRGRLARCLGGARASPQPPMRLGVQGTPPSGPPPRRGSASVEGCAQHLTETPRPLGRIPLVRSTGTRVISPELPFRSLVIFLTVRRNPNGEQS